LTNLLSIFANNVLPILLAAGAGFLLSKLTGLSPRPFSLLVFYVFIPCLLFKLLTTSDLAGEDIIRMVGFTLVSTLVLGVVVVAITGALRLEKSVIAGLLLAILFSNAGNYGLTLNKFAFGDLALAYAGIYFAVSIVLINTLGIVIANLGNSGKNNPLVGLLKTPALYAMLLALVFNMTGWNFPAPLQRTVFLLADGTIPLMVILMGVQLQNSQWTGQVGLLSFSTLMRLFAAPLIALPTAFLFGLEGPAHQAAITESSLPTAVVMTVLATEYGVEPSLVTLSVLATTLLSPLTITPIIAMLGA
jgi:predicted permease